MSAADALFAVARGDASSMLLSTCRLAASAAEPSRPRTAGSAAAVVVRPSSARNSRRVTTVEGRGSGFVVMLGRTPVREALR